jgi:hypothetical protein
MARPGSTALNDGKGDEEVRKQDAAAKCLVVHLVRASVLYVRLYWCIYVTRKLG